MDIFIVIILYINDLRLLVTTGGLYWLIGWKFEMPLKKAYAFIGNKIRGGSGVKPTPVRKIQPRDSAHGRRQMKGSKGYTKTPKMINFAVFKQ